MVMFCCCYPSSTSALLLVLLSLTPLLALAAPALQQRSSVSSSINEALNLAKEDPGAAEGAARTHRKVDSLLQKPLGQEHVSDMDSASSLASVLLEALDHPVREKMIQGDSEEGFAIEAMRNQGDFEQGTEKLAEVVQQGEENWGQEKPKDESENVMEDKVNTAEGTGGQRQSNVANPLQRKTRGYFQNIDLGLQDNEILPPLKGYKAYNQQLAQATKKLKWQEEQTKNPSQLDRNFMDDFDFVEEEEEEILTRKEEEEARARAEQEEVRRQEAEAQEAREEEQRLADIASDMLLEYMGRKQKASSYMRDMKAAALLNNVAEDKRSNEVEDNDDDDEMDPQTIDKLIEISSKLHLPADDVVEIISDVQEKKKKRKDLPPSNTPRFRPLVPLKAKPRPQAYQYPKSPKKSSYTVDPYKKWYKEKNKGKLSKQDYWFKPQKQFLAYPSFPYYQKPYRAYYPVFFPPPKPRFYTNPALSFDYNFGGSMGYGLKPPSRRYRDRPKARDWKWAQPPQRPQSPYPQPDTVISNYILPHPRTYQALPMPKPRSPQSGRAPSYIYPPDYVYDEPESPQESDEELENFIEKIYYNRRLF
ncbi:golgin subfamily A member 6-like protein 2 [Onychostoma macrolepis]|uniref:golgin subfamily A member 6-like protein 2 n=1 Tax=Onychostoma macrolepis TaxID=369639 RepID=UPI0027296783|nr:golgin subfamily A member 6-like protein 2 [Onychostoma macrolepis]XP_058646108.1 golgin subfamily A member 6-like protein 2 [Onychostoma macrolepis]